MEHVIFQFNESYQPYDTDLDEETYQSLCWSRTHRVSTRKLEAFKEAESFKFGYVEHLIERAMKGFYNLGSSRKYSFSDCIGWYEDLQPDEDCTDRVIQVYVELS